LGIPTVVDRLIQQALHQVLSPLFEPNFSQSSYGFRPGRSAQQAVLAAQEHVAEGRRWVVDLDLEKFFDRVNHELAGACDKLKFVGRFLGAFLLTFQVVSIGRTRLRPEGVRPITPHDVVAAKNFHIELMLTPMRGLRAWPFGSTP